MKVHVTQLQGITFAARGGSQHWVMMDGPKEFGGSEAGSRPMEMILYGFAGCAGSDIASILKKMRAELTSFEIDIDAETAEEHPKVFTKIHLRFLVAGNNLKEKDLERAIEMTRTKYCPVWAMLKESVEISYSYDIQQAEYQKGE
ncbi:osmotically inducible protein OsmC [candidate division KSB3 bacterium]|uniref:Osmotically inducible protein OsmC n=1 Tax=candidate division KSB3 bacterium TaxID=2044937 RepID=A0A2G6E2M1_9BACT|nr:MAG: osmotically inducible protein OsmC [candidate division KSB3 bacterium]PIE29296.1 MAG: osmotically inducible protein OsmC [candidate division KSB3 bacterium]